MNEVFVVMESVETGDGRLIGVFSTREKAQSFINVRQVVFNLYYYSIEEMIIDDYRP